ncbi:Hypothetical predicted protein [Podarcis lilfordi]|uniref:Uncharacterized protein n=1 Tax=Podarcis lilfordi TaxID=74358 RepID=A0AA35KMV6_9SAUR|nr:Hypothetical predicted protein [Podarcis lilfordi]
MPFIFKKKIKNCCKLNVLEHALDTEKAPDSIHGRRKTESKFYNSEQLFPRTEKQLKIFGYTSLVVSSVILPHQHAGTPGIFALLSFNTDRHFSGM